MALENPRFEDSPALFITGLHRDYPRNQTDRAAEQWGVLSTPLQVVTGRVDGKTYGVWFDVLKPDRPMKLVTGARVGQFAPINAQLSLFEIPAQRYAIFTHRGHVSELRNTLKEILENWLPKSGKKHAHAHEGAPDFLEVYPEGFDPEEGLGPIELWLPIR